MTPAIARIARANLLFAWAALLAACGDSTAPSGGTAAGTWAATTYLVGDAGSAPRDVLAAGGAYQLVLADGGRMFQEIDLPGAITGEGDQGMTVEGTWRQDGAVVSLVDIFADPQYQPSRLTVSGDSLVGEQTTGGFYVKVVFRR